MKPVSLLSIPVMSVLLVGPGPASAHQAAARAPTVEAPAPVAAPAPPAETSGWRTLEPGLELGEFDLPETSDVGDSRLRVLRIDPKLWHLRLLCAGNLGDGSAHTARDWCSEYGLAAAINASMFQGDGRTSVAHMRTGEYVNNGALSDDNAVLAFDPSGLRDVPPVKLLDLQCEDYADWRDLYGTFIQDIRMVTCRGGNAWSRQDRRWSTACVGQDSTGRVLLIHVRSPYPVHDLIDGLMALPLGLTRAMYVEGGPEAQLYVHAGDVEEEYVGSYETGFNENEDNHVAWPVPNVIGVERVRP